jgi:CheY-like chemotaxis protein
MNEISLLLVEDNDDDRFLTMRVLRKLPFPVRIETARNGDEALRLITAAEGDPGLLPSLVMLDLQMPKIGGLSLLARIRELFSQEELPAIVLSSSDNPGDIAACREMGITAYLAKPPDLQRLQEALGPVRA